MRTITIILLSLLIVLCLGIIYVEDEKPPAKSTTSDPQKISLKVNYLKSRGYHYLYQKKGDLALPYLQEAAALSPSDKNLQELVSKLEKAKEAVAKRQRD
jgi:hypothetical protein